MSLHVGVYESVGAPEAHSVFALQEQRIKRSLGFLRVMTSPQVRLHGVRSVWLDEFLNQDWKLQTEQENEGSTLTENSVERNRLVKRRWRSGNIKGARFVKYYLNIIMHYTVPWRRTSSSVQNVCVFLMIYLSISARMSGRAVAMSTPQLNFLPNGTSHTTMSTEAEGSGVATLQRHRQKVCNSQVQHSTDQP